MSLDTVPAVRTCQTARLAVPTKAEMRSNISFLSLVCTPSPPSGSGGGSHQADAGTSGVARMGDIIGWGALV